MITCELTFLTSHRLQVVGNSSPETVRIFGTSHIIDPHLESLESIETTGTLSWMTVLINLLEH